MVWHFLLVENELGLRVGEGIGISRRRRAPPEPLRTQTLTEEDRRTGSPTSARTRRATSAGLTMTHCVPNERVVVEN